MLNKLKTFFNSLINKYKVPKVNGLVTRLCHINRLNGLINRLNQANNVDNMDAVFENMLNHMNLQEFFSHFNFVEGDAYTKYPINIPITVIHTPQSIMPDEYLDNVISFEILADVCRNLVKGLQTRIGRRINPEGISFVTDSFRSEKVYVVSPMVATYIGLSLHEELDIYPHGVMGKSIIYVDRMALVDYIMEIPSSLTVEIGEVSKVTYTSEGGVFNKNDIFLTDSKVNLKLNIPMNIILPYDKGIGTYVNFSK